MLSSHFHRSVLSRTGMYARKDVGGRVASGTSGRDESRIDSIIVSLKTLNISAIRIISSQQAAGGRIYNGRYFAMVASSNRRMRMPGQRIMTGPDTAPR